MNSKINFINILANSRRIFFYFVKECNDNYREGDDLNFYREIIDMHRKTGDLSVLMGNENFYKKIHVTLKMWNMDQRRAILADLDTIKKSIRRLVGVSKTLHFLLPDLVMPVDGKYTMECFYGYNKTAESPDTISLIKNLTNKTRRS